jgi:hypothetical protein
LRLRVERFLCILLTREWLLRFPRFGLCAIFRRKNLRALQIFVRINVLRFLLLILLAGLLLARSVSNILGVTL